MLYETKATRLALAALLATGGTWLASPPACARDLTFEERIAAQGALERVYYAHQIGATKPFEEAVPRAVLEAKVDKYLKQSTALETLWKTPVTAEMLQAEMERQAWQSRMPERLRELYAALGDDPFVVRECLARPALVDRLTRSFFAFDGRFHAAARAEAEELRRGLLRYGVDAFASDPRRSEAEIVLAEGEEEEPRGRRIALGAEEFARWRALAPQQPGEIGPLREEREAFVISVLLEEGSASARIASFAVAKRSWDSWWDETAKTLDASSAAPAGGAGLLPALTFARLKHEEQGRQPFAGPDNTCLPNDVWDNGALDDVYVPEARHGQSVVWTGSLMVAWGGQDSDYMNTGGRYDPATDSWTPTSTLGAPTKRSYHTAVWTGSLMVVWGGQGGGKTGGRYDPTTNSWTPTSTVGAPAARDGHSAVWTGSRMVVWGGDTGTSFLNTGGRYDPIADSWAPTSTVGAPAPRFGHSAVWTGSQMIVWGGHGVDTTLLNTGGRYDPATDSWLPTSTAGAPLRRFGHTAVWTGNQMIVWGGQGGTPIDYLNTGGRYDPVTNAWTSVSTVGAPSSRDEHGAVWTGSLMVVWGGYGGDYQNTGGRYDPGSDSWTPTSTLGAPAPRLGHSAVWTGSLMVAWGGVSDNAGDLNTGGRYDPTMDAWAPMMTSGRTRHTAVWTGSQMIVWGGEEGFGLYVGSGARYDPATDTWTPVSMTGAPSARVGHTAQWTGGLMVVWGGDAPGPGAHLNTGGRYEPAADTWAPTSTLGAPAGRADHTAVWTGNVIVVWGGVGAGGNLSTGGRYDPAMDSWTATSSVGAPAARTGHTAVWTGSLMVVWGGQSTSNLKTGGRYDPSTDGWTPTSTVDAPKARWRHTAVWTGSSMVVWGGSDTFDTYTSTGGRYDPLADGWTSTSTVGAPSPRYRHTAVWTGDRMVVWGGWGSGDSGYTGRRYDAVNDTWTPTSTLGAPSSRYDHSAVWTGSSMIVWGGQWVDPLSTGGRYVLGESSDADGDGFTCAMDCNDADAGVVAIPTEVTGLAFAADGETLEWDSSIPGAGSATVHDVLTGLLAELPVGSGAGEACLDSTSAASIGVSDVPSSGSGSWYLVRGRNLCGDGTYGSASDGTPRASDACP